MMWLLWSLSLFCPVCRQIATDRHRVKYQGQCCFHRHRNVADQVRVISSSRGHQ